MTDEHAVLVWLLIEDNGSVQATEYTDTENESHALYRTLERAEADSASRSGGSLW